MNSQKIKTQIRNLFTKKRGVLLDVNELNHWYNSMKGTQPKPNGIDLIKAKSWKKIQSQMQVPQRKNVKGNKPIFGSWIWKAAILLILCGAGYGLFTRLPEKAADVVIAAGSFSNDLGKISSFLLPDGSKVWLSTRSTVEYAEDFPRNRKVKLSGEAFFEVFHNPDSPFEVVTGQITTEVLGTSFNLKSYDQASVELSVYSGRVRFGDQQADADSAVLLKGERISWTAERGLSEIEQFDLSQLPDWRLGKISFDHADLKAIKTTLERWYKVEISLEGQGKNCHYSGEFTQSSLEHILQTLSYSLNLTYKINDAHVTIHANPC